jgi:hypothetical protein
MSARRAANGRNGWKGDMSKGTLCGMALKMFVSALAALCTFASAPPITASPVDDSECFDAQVYARIAHQTPTILGNCDPNCIVMDWPWILELDVDRVLNGNVRSNHVTVLTVQHTYYRTHLGARRWWLRRNSLGAYNALKRGDATHLPRCPRGTAPARPYIQPPTGKTLADLAREGEAYYGRGP